MPRLLFALALLRLCVAILPPLGPASLLEPFDPLGDDPCLRDFYPMVKWNSADSIADWAARRNATIAATKLQEPQRGAPSASSQQKMLLVSAYDEGYRSIVQAASAGHRDYCTRHACEFEVADYTQPYLGELPSSIVAASTGVDNLWLPDRHPAWNKLLVIRDALRRAPLVVWIDSDAVIVNNTISFVDYLTDEPADVDIVLARDPGYSLEEHRRVGSLMVNTGVMMFRNSSYTTAMLDDLLWSDAYAQFYQEHNWEQAAIRVALCRSPQHFRVLEDDRFQRRHAQLETLTVDGVAQLARDGVFVFHPQSTSRSVKEESLRTAINAWRLGSQVIHAQS